MLDIFSVCTFLFLDTIMSIKEENAESELPKVEKQEELYTTQIFTDELLASLGGFKEE